MPTEFGPGTLFIMGPDGETLGEFPTIPELTLTTVNSADEINLTTLLPFESCEAVITGNLDINRKVFLRVILGKSNNWLKMHGYPMVRKGARR